MNNQGNGKIARLSREIQEQLNFRMYNGERGKPLVEWLNSLPEVRAMVTHVFGGTPVREQSISEWRKRGYREWLAQRKALEAICRLNADTLAVIEGAGLDFTDNVALWLTTHYLVAAQEAVDKDGGLDWKRLREFCSDLVKLRRGDHTAARLEIDSKRQRVQEMFSINRWKRRVIQGLETLEAYVSVNPKAKALYKQLFDEVGTHYDKMRGAP